MGSGLSKDSSNKKQTIAFLILLVMGIGGLWFWSQRNIENKQLEDEKKEEAFEIKTDARIDSLVAREKAEEEKEERDFAEIKAAVGVDVEKEESKDHVDININVKSQQQSAPKTEIVYVEKQVVTEPVEEKEKPVVRGGFRATENGEKSNLVFVPCEVYKTSVIANGTTVRFRVLETKSNIKKNTLISAVAKVVDSRVFMNVSFIEGSNRGGKVFDSNHLEGIEKITQRNKVIITQGQRVYLGI